MGPFAAVDVSLIAGTFNRAYMAAATPAARALAAALPSPGRAQMNILHAILASNARCEFGRAHGFASIKTHSEFAESVPLSDYEDVRPDVTRIRGGERQVRTCEDVEFLEPTGGSSGVSKLIPYTNSLKRQIARAAHPWIRDLFVHRPALRNGRGYWAVSPPHVFANDEAGTRIGAPHDLDYLPRPVASLVERALALPRTVSDIDEIDATRYVTLRALLAVEDLAFVSVWNPSFLTLLMEELDPSFDMLLHDLERGGISVHLEPSLRARLERSLPARPGVAALLRRRFGSAPPVDLGEVWPRLRVISCWTDGHAGRALAAMRGRFPHVEVQGKGLIATEGIVSVPLLDHAAPVAAVTSHFLEFVPENGGDPRLADEVEDGSTYEVVLTTGGGLYRYRLKDIARVEGFVGETPMLRFVGRADGASDLCGEKLTPAFVERALSSAADACRVRPRFALLAPRWDDPPRYDLWVELEAPDEGRASLLAAAVEDELRRAHHYALCRSLGQLAPVRARCVPDAERLYERACTSRGMRAGTVKPPVLSPDFGWSEFFEEVATACAR